MSFSSDDGLCNVSAYSHPVLTVPWLENAPKSAQECHKKPKKNEYDAWYRKYVVQAYCSVTCKESASRRKDREMAAAAMQRSVARQDVNAAPTTSRASPLQSLAQATPTATAQPRRDGALNGSPAHAQRTVDNTVIPNTVRSTGITYDAMCCVNASDLSHLHTCSRACSQKCGIRPRKTTVHVQDDCKSPIWKLCLRLERQL